MNGPERAAHTVELLRQVAARYPTVDAFVDAEGHRLSFGAWDRAADGVAAGLADHGVVAGDVVCLLVPSSLEYMVCYQAAMRLGAITTGVNIRLGRDEIEHIIRATTPRVTVVADDEERVLPATAGTVVRSSQLARFWSADAPPLPTVRARQPVLICWTGGTTGRPKGAVFDHDSLAAVARATGALSAAFDRRLSPIPFAHVATMTRAWDEISRVITTVITPARWTAAAALRLIEQERVTVAQGVPTQWELMLRDPVIETADLSTVRLAGIGGSRVPPDLVQRMRAVLGVPVVNRYASTEAGGVISGTRPDDPEEVIVETVGRASDGVEVRVAEDDGTPRAVGEVGRVQVRSGAVMRGYWRDPDATGAVLDADGWLTVGDVGRLDAAISRWSADWVSATYAARTTSIPSKSNVSSRSTTASPRLRLSARPIPCWAKSALPMWSRSVRSMNTSCSSSRAHGSRITKFLIASSRSTSCRSPRSGRSTGGRSRRGRAKDRVGGSPALRANGNFGR